MKYQKMFQKLVCFLLVWNLLLTWSLVVQFCNKQADKLNEQICMLEEIPTNPPEYEIVEGL